MVVGLTRDGRRRQETVGALVLAAFVGHRPSGMYVCHDPDPTPNNNTLENLRWGTSKENKADCMRLGRHARGEAVWTAKLTAPDVIAIRRRYADGESRPALARHFGVTRQNITDIVNGATWRHIT